MPKQNEVTDEFRHKICCCMAASDYHSENQKFILFGKDQDINTPIFDLRERKTGEVVIQHDLPKCNSAYWTERDRLYLFERNLEIHTIIDRMTGTNEKRLIYVQGEMGVGKSAIINEAIRFLFTRNHPVCRDGILKVDISMATKHTIK